MQDNQAAMQKFLRSYKFAAILSALLVLYADVYIHFIPGLICYVPLFIALQGLSRREAFKAGYIFGVTLSLTSLFWIIPGAVRFTGGAMFYGIIVYVLSAIFIPFYFSLLTWGFKSLQPQINTKYKTILSALLISAIYVVGEQLLTFLSDGMPWFGLHSGNAMINNLYALQPAEYLGIHGISFIVVFVNYLVANSLYRKQPVKLVWPASLVLIYMVSGYLIKNNLEEKIRPAKEVSIAILAENIEPEIRWDDKTGNQLVRQLMELDKRGAAFKPDILLWSESSIPWTYRPDDDLLDTLLKISGPSNSTHIIGINSDYEKNIVYNSVYAFDPAGKLSGRYDKRYLLSFIEEPVAGKYIPFFSSGGFLVKPGDSADPLPTPYGKAGVMICNESAVSRSSADMVKNGAEFIVNLSNDGWFNDTYLVDLHFYNVRLRAVETRKDIAINSNNGYCGLVNAGGEVIMKEMSTDPFVRMVSVNTNAYKTLNTKLPLLVVYISLFILLMFIALKIFKGTVGKSEKQVSKKVSEKKAN